ncbi:MAG TPA: lytic murein transglycosylase B [Gallionellaceae bacterium]
MVLRIFVSLLLCSACASGWAYDSPAIPAFIDEMVTRHQFKRDELDRTFEKAQYKQPIIDAITNPATSKPWPEYRANFVNDARVAQGLKFWKKNAEALRRAEDQYGVPQEIIVALLGVETFYGQQAGTYRTLDALSTLAFSYPPRADFFRSELEQYLLLAREQRFDLLGIRGSYAGALGYPQFMPSSYRKYAVDFNLNGRIDLLNERADAIGSAANYLKQYGWVRGEPIAVRAKFSGEFCPGDVKTPRSIGAWAEAGISLVQPYAPGKEPAKPARLLDFTVNDGKEFWLAFGNFDVIMTYNNSSFYAMTVLQLAEELRAARMGKRSR